MTGVFARLFSVTPSRRTLGLVAGWLAVALAASLWSPLQWLWGVLGVLIALGMLIDFGLALRLPCVRLERDVAGALALDATTQATVRVHNPSEHPVRAVVFEPTRLLSS